MISNCERLTNKKLFKIMYVDSFTYFSAAINIIDTKKEYNSGDN